MMDEEWLPFPDAEAFALRETRLAHADQLLNDAMIHGRVRSRYPGEPPFPLYPARVLAEVHGGDLRDWVKALCEGRPFKAGTKAPDWGAFEEALRLQVSEMGLPDKDGPDHWRNKSDVARWAEKFFAGKNERAPWDTIRKHVSTELSKLAAANIGHGRANSR
jgi:hypothetical protein